jgi:hypothetical protein
MALLRWYRSVCIAPHRWLFIDRFYYRVCLQPTTVLLFWFACHGNIWEAKTACFSLMKREFCKQNYTLFVRRQNSLVQSAGIAWRKRISLVCGFLNCSDYLDCFRITAICTVYSSVVCNVTVFANGTNDNWISGPLIDIQKWMNICQM